MKKLFLFVFVLVLAAGLFEPAHAQKETLHAGEILTAIDVVDLLNSGSSEADIAKTLSGQGNFDRKGATGKGKTDKQIINYLITGPINPGSSIDNSKSTPHKFEGDKYFKESKYDKAATEYTLAIKKSKDNQALYKLRGDSYRQYLLSKFPASGSTKDEIKHTSRILLCGAMYSDYKKALDINNKAIQNNNSSIKLLEYQMSNKELAIVNKSDVAPYHNRAAGNILGMREMDRLYRLQRSANHFNLNIKKAISNYKLVCSEEDAALRKSLIIEKGNNRDKKWIKYEDRGETSYFYDKSGIEKSKGNLIIWTRNERNDDERANDVARVRINCKKRIIGTIEYSSYDETGNLLQKQHVDNVTMKTVMPGTITEKLFKEVCN